MGIGGQVIEEASDHFKRAVDNICRTPELLLSRVKSMPDPPDEFEVTMGLNINGENISITAGDNSSRAHYHLKFKWKRRDDSISVIKA